MHAATSRTSAAARTSGCAALAGCADRGCETGTGSAGPAAAFLLAARSQDAVRRCFAQLQGYIDNAPVRRCAGRLCRQLCCLSSCVWLRSQRLWYVELLCRQAHASVPVPQWCLLVHRAAHRRPTPRSPPRPACRGTPPASSREASHETTRTSGASCSLKAHHGSPGWLFLRLWIAGLRSGRF